MLILKINQKKLHFDLDEKSGITTKVERLDSERTKMNDWILSNYKKITGKRVDYAAVVAASDMIFIMKIELSNLLDKTYSSKNCDSQFAKDIRDVLIFINENHPNYVDNITI